MPKALKEKGRAVMREMMREAHLLARKPYLSATED
jgi:hypothetical protein